MLDKPCSFNNKLITETYTAGEIRADSSSGWAKIDQKNNVKGLKLLVESKFLDGTVVPVGSLIYVREDALHTQAWAKKITKSDSLKQNFIVVNLADVEYIAPPSKD